MRKVILTVAIVIVTLATQAAPKQRPIIVSAQGVSITLTPHQIIFLRAIHVGSVLKALNNFKDGGTIRNTDVADIILKQLGYIATSGR